MPSARPCIICATPTADRSGTVGWRRHTPRCADAVACAKRRDDARARPRGRAHIGGKEIVFEEASDADRA